MKAQLLYTVKLFLFIFVLFTLGRLCFMGVYASLFAQQGLSIGEFFGIFYHAFLLDLSTFCYVYILLWLILSLSAIFPHKIWKIVASVYIGIIVFVYLSTVVSEIGVYGEWRTKLNYKAIQYWQNPSEVYKTASTGIFFGLASALIVLNIVMMFFYQKWVATTFLKRAKWYSILPYFILTPAFCFLGIRGGVDAIPISQSHAFFSNKEILNDVTANPVWSLMQNTIDSRGYLEGNPYVFYEREEAEKQLEQIFEIDENIETPSILQVSRPNIVLILLESWSADLIQSLSGDSLNFTPCFQELEKESLVFTQAYAGGKRSQQGIAALLAGFPALPQIVITNYPEKSRKLPSLVKLLKKQDYQSSFYFGGDLMYGNILSFLHSCDFDKIIERKDIKSREKQGKLGYHDAVVFDLHLKDFKEKTSPFFSVIYTGSSHPPYDQPTKAKFTQKLPEIAYLNSAYYSDSCLGVYMKEVRKQTWYDSTLFIIVADHSHETHKQRSYFTFDYVRIPMLFFGPALRPEYRGVRFDKLVGQNDIPATICAQMGISSTDFSWSRNIFHPQSKEFVYIEAQDGLGFKTPQGQFFYHLPGDRLFDNTLNPTYSDSIVKLGKSYLQVLFQQVVDL